MWAHNAQQVLQAKWWLYRLSHCYVCIVYDFQLSVILILHGLVLHPRYKSTYFQKAGWPQEWIQTAEDILRKEWKVNYKLSTSEPVQDSAVSLNVYYLMLYLMNVCSLQQRKTGILMTLTPSMLLVPPTQLTSGWIHLLLLVQMACNGGMQSPLIHFIIWLWIFCRCLVCFPKFWDILLVVF